MKGRNRIIFDLTGIVLLLPVLTVFVWLSSDGHIYFSRDFGYYDDAVWVFLESNMGGEWLFQNGIYNETNRTGERYYR